MCLKPSNTKKTETRTAKVQKIGEVTVLWLTVGKLTTAYKLESLPSQLGGQGYRLSKADCGKGEPEVYDVHLAGSRSTCECLGHLKHGHCKHCSALSAVLANGKLF